MSDLESCSLVLQHDSVLQVCNAAISACVDAEMDNIDPLGLLQSPSPPRERRRRRARSSPPVRRRVRLVSCERGETAEVPRSQSPRGKVPPPPRSDPADESRPQSPRSRVPPPPPPPQHARRRDDPPLEKQMPVPIARRAIAPQPPPPPMGRVTPAQLQPPHQQATAIQEQMESIQPRPKPDGEPTTENDRQRHVAKQQINAEKQGTTKHMETAAPAVTTTDPERAPETTGQKTTNVELVYHGSFAPFHLGHLA
eukprot:1947123-Amphidinium_carterae.1